jgi:hypothetical protein
LQLSPKAINILANIKAELLSKQVATTDVVSKPQDVIITLKRPKKEPPTTVVMRHARRPNAFQRMCQRGDWAAPRY